MSSKVNQPSTSLLEEDDFSPDDPDNFRTTRVNLDLDLNDRSLKPEQIVSLFIEIAQRAEKCFDFELSAWLEKYELMRQHPNFAEAALLISSASQIYGRKFNYFEDLVLRLAGAAKDEKNKEQEKEGETDQTKVVRRRGKKFRTNTIADSLSEAEFIVKEFDQLPTLKLTEIIKKKKVDFDSHWEKFKASQCRFMKNKKNKLVVSKKMTTDNSEIIATNATFGKTHVFDYDGEEVVGTKADFRCFSNILNDDCELIRDYDFTKYFQHVDMVNQKEGMPIPPVARRFKFYISKEYLKQSYGIKIDTMDISTVKETPVDSTLEQNITEFSDMITPGTTQLNDTTENIDTLNNSAKSVVSCDSAYQSIVSTQSSSPNQTLETIPEVDETGQEAFFDALDTQDDMQIDKELTEYNLAQKTMEDGFRSPRDPDNNSLDEGISIRSLSIRSPMNMSETGSEMNLDMIFQNGASTIFQNIMNKVHEEVDNTETAYENFINKSNLFCIDRVYLEHKEEFELPFQYLLRQAPLERNFLNLPEQKVRRRCLFALPLDDFKPRLTYTKLPAEPPTPRVFKVQLFKISDLIEQNRDSATKEHSESSDDEEFRGFDEELELNFANPGPTTSTPYKKQTDSDEVIEGKRKAVEPLDSQPNVKRVSIDDPNGVMTDDEDTPKSNDDDLSTPERIRRAAQARMSRDSGVISPEPDETLTIELSDVPNAPVSIELRRNSDSADSEKSYASAEDAPTLPVLSNHDKKLVAQAQEKYQHQVSEMQTLVEKVNRWHQYLKPILKASQERSEFDIHECGTEVLETFHEESGQDEATFADVMTTKPEDHFARYFLATLMLVNTGNLELTNKNKDVDRISEPNEIQLKLKSRIRLHEEIENMDETVPCISSNKNGDVKKGKRKAESDLIQNTKPKNMKLQASTSSKEYL